jgi:hypothetical protein
VEVIIMQRNGCIAFGLCHGQQKRAKAANPLAVMLLSDGRILGGQARLVEGPKDSLKDNNLLGEFGDEKLWFGWSGEYNSVFFARVSNGVRSIAVVDQPQLTHDSYAVAVMSGKQTWVNATFELGLPYGIAEALKAAHTVSTRALTAKPLAEGEAQTTTTTTTSFVNGVEALVKPELSSSTISNDSSPSMATSVPLSIPPPYLPLKDGEDVPAMLHGGYTQAEVKLEPGLPPPLSPSPFL